MKRLTLALAACLLFASISFAQQSDADAPASKADIERYLDAMHTRDTMKSMLEIMTTQMRKITHERIQKAPNLPPDSEERMNEMMDAELKEFPINELLDVMVPVYQKHFTKGDIDTLVTFYSAPTGQKILKEMPAIMAESMQASSAVVQKMMANMTQRIDNELAQLQKADDGKSDKPSPSTPN